jgi:hypothetical protein
MIFNTSERNNFPHHHFQKDRIVMVPTNSLELKKGDYVVHTYAHDPMRNQQLPPRIGIVSVTAKTYCFVKFKTGEQDVSYTELKKLEDQSFQLYKDSKEKCFVKYADQEEREISKQEFDELTDIKVKILEGVVKSPVIYEQKEKEYTVLFEGAKNMFKLDPLEDKEGKRNFLYGTCKGQMYYGERSLVICNISNDEKQNGCFGELINALKHRVQYRPDLSFLVFESIYNPKLVSHLQKKKFIKITNTTCIWM